MNDSFDWYKLSDPTLVDEDSLRIHEIKSIRCREKKYCLIRISEGYFMVDEKCPHAYGKLVNGWCEKDNSIVCPVHRFKFDIATGKNIDGEGYTISSYKIEIRADGFYVAFPKKKWYEFW